MRPCARMPNNMAGPSSVCVTDSVREMSVIELYGTAACHLCDQAIAMLEHVGCSALYIDIASADDKFDRYALRIPVLRRADSGAELDWPFDIVAVLAFIS